MRILGSLLIGVGGITLVYLALRLARSRDEHLAWAQGQTFMSGGWMRKRAEDELELGH